MIDNFDLIKSHLTFESVFDRYIIQIIKRFKDDPDKEKKLKWKSKDNIIINTMYVSSMEYLENRIENIKNLCNINNARAYILPQVRDNEQCLKILAKDIIDNFLNPTVNIESLISSAYCGNHMSRAKRWIIDYDDKDKKLHGYEFEFVVELIKQNHLTIGNNPETDMYIVPTKNGKHIVTKPFNLEKCFKKCDMLYQGTKKRVVGKEYTCPDKSIDIIKDVPGFLIKDGMTILYIPDFK